MTSPNLEVSAGVMAVAGALLGWAVGMRRAARRIHDLTGCRKALDTLSFEAVNLVNAVRLNLMAFRQANPSPEMPEHLEQIDRSLDRLLRALDRHAPRRAS